MAEPVLRGVTTNTPASGASAVATVNTATGTVTGDTVFVMQSLNFTDLTNMTGPTATGITFDVDPIKKVKYGNTLLGVWRGEVTTDGIKTISLPQAAAASSNFPMCFTYEGQTEVDGTPQEAGNATGTSTVAIPATNVLDAAAHLIAVWASYTSTGNHVGSMIDTPTSMDANRTQTPHTGSNTMELTSGWEELSATGGTGSRTATLRDATSTPITAHAGFCGVMFAVTRISDDLPPIVSAGSDIADHPVNTPVEILASEDSQGTPINVREWRVISGPAEVNDVIGDTSTLFWVPLTVGNYVLRYTATSPGGQDSDDVAVEVIAAPPVANAGTDLSIVLGQSFNRNGGETGLGITARGWEVISGPSDVGEEWNSQGISWTPPFIGEYVMRYAVTNPQGTDTDDMTLTITAPPTPPGEPVDGWTYLTVPWGEEEATLRDQLAGQQYELQIRALDVSNNASDWSESIFVQTEPDDQPPSTPAAAEVAASRTAIQVKHFLGKSTGGTFNLEGDLKELRFHVGLEPDFAKNDDPVDVPDGTFAGSIEATVAHLLGQIPIVGTFQIPQTEEVWVKCLAVDNAGNESELSSGVQATAELIPNAYIANLDVSKILAGTILTDWLQAASMRTGVSPNARVVTAYHGIEAYNGSNILTFDLNASNGSFSAIGTLTSGVTGRRVRIDGTSNDIVFFPQIGESRKATIYSYIPANFPNDIALEMRAIDSDESDWIARHYLLPDTTAMLVSPVGAGGDLLQRTQVRIDNNGAAMGVYDISGSPGSFVGSGRAELSMTDTVVRLDNKTGSATDGGYFNSVRGASGFAYVGYFRTTGSHDKYIRLDADEIVMSYQSDFFYRQQSEQHQFYIDGILSFRVRNPPASDTPFVESPRYCSINEGPFYGQVQDKSGSFYIQLFEGNHWLQITGSPTLTLNLNALDALVDGNILARLNALEAHATGGIPTGHHIHP